MKKKYVKPALAIEMLEISEQIANCDKKINFGQNSCYVNTGFSKLFADSAPCNYDMTKEGSHFDKYCYHVPLGKGSFFQS